MLPCSLFARSLGAAAFSTCRRLLLDFTANVALRIGTTSGMAVRLVCPAQGAFRCRDVQLLDERSSLRWFRTAAGATMSSLLSSRSDGSGYLVRGFTGDMRH